MTCPPRGRQSECNQERREDPQRSTAAGTASRCGAWEFRVGRKPGVASRTMIRLLRGSRILGRPGRFFIVGARPGWGHAAERIACAPAARTAALTGSLHEDAVGDRRALLDDLDLCPPVNGACLSLRCGLRNLIRLRGDPARGGDIRLNGPAVAAYIGHARLEGGRLSRRDLAHRRALLDDLHLTPGHLATVLDLQGGLCCL